MKHWLQLIAGTLFFLLMTSNILWLKQYEKDQATLDIMTDIVEEAQYCEMRLEMCMDMDCAMVSQSCCIECYEALSEWGKAVAEIVRRRDRDD